MLKISRKKREIIDSKIKAITAEIHCQSETNVYRSIKEVLEYNHIKLDSDENYYNPLMDYYHSVCEKEKPWVLLELKRLYDNRENYMVDELRELLTNPVFGKTISDMDLMLVKNPYSERLFSINNFDGQIKYSLKTYHIDREDDQYYQKDENFVIEEKLLEDDAYLILKEIRNVLSEKKITGKIEFF